MLQFLFITNILSIIGLFSYSVWILIRQGRILILPNLLQLVLFGSLYFLIFTIYGKDNYTFINEPTWFDWIQFTIVHVLREAYRFNIQNIKHANATVATVIMAMHWMVDVFLLGLIWKLISTQKKQHQKKQKFTKPKSELNTFIREFIFIIVIFAIYTTAVMQSWSENRDTVWLIWNFVIVWPLDNILRLIDVGDALQLYGIHLHQIELNYWTATLSIAFRILISIPVTRFLSRLYILPTTDELIAKLGNPQTCQNAIVELTKFGNHAVLELIQALAHPNPEIRQNVADTLYQIAPDSKALIALVNADTSKADIIAALKSALTDPEWYIQKIAAEILSKIGSQAEVAIPILVETLADVDLDVKKASITALYNIDKHWPTNPKTSRTLLDLAEWINQNVYVDKRLSEILNSIDANHRSSLSKFVAALEQHNIFTKVEINTITSALVRVLSTPQDIQAKTAIIKHVDKNSGALVLALVQALHSAAAYNLNIRRKCKTITDQHQKIQPKSAFVSNNRTGINRYITGWLESKHSKTIVHVIMASILLIGFHLYFWGLKTISRQRHLEQARLQEHRDRMESLERKRRAKMEEIRVERLARQAKRRARRAARRAELEARKAEWEVRRATKHAQIEVRRAEWRAKQAELREQRADRRARREARRAAKRAARWRARQID